MRALESLPEASPGPRARGVPPEAGVLALALLAAVFRVCVACGAPRWLLWTAVVAAGVAAAVVALRRGRPRLWLDRWRLPLLLLLLLELPQVYPRLGGDGYEYYAVARSLLLDRDLDLANDFAGLGAAPVVSPLGQVTARTPLGLSLLWMPVIAVAHAVTAAAAALGAPFTPDGFSPPYMASVTVASFLFGAAALLVVEALVRRIHGPAVALVCAAALWLATPLQFYSVANPFMSHAASALAAALFVTAWLRWRDREDGPAWVALGLIGALMTLVRIQDVVLLALPVVDLAVRPTPARARRLALFAVGPALAALAQSLVWARLWSADFARILATQGPGVRWPEWVGLLFSPRHGLFTWTPLYAVAVAGWLGWLRRDARLGLYWFGAFAAAVAVNSSLGDWWGSESFGQRRLLGLTAIFALGLAEAVALALRRPLLPVAAVLAVAVLWNQQLAAVYNAELAGRRGEAIHLDRLLAAQGELFDRRLARWEGSLPRGLWLLLYDNLRGVWLDEGTRSLGGVVELGGEEPPDLEPLLAHNWARPESEGEESFRRVKGRRARLRVPIRTPGDFEVTVRLRSEMPGVPLRFTLEVNGHAVGSTLLEPRWSEHRFDVPAAAVRPGFNDVSLAFSATPREVVTGHRGKDTPAAVDRLVFTR